eukprot:6189666-Pleurochrysis_carterae.AAC.2
MLFLTIQSKHKQVNQALWAQLCQVRVLPSLKWMEDFVADALKLEKDYIPKYDAVDWISAAVFDNYTKQLNYSAAHNPNTQCERLDTTNWATLYLSARTFYLTLSWDA